MQQAGGRKTCFLRPASCFLLVAMAVAGCAQKPAPDTLVMIIESSPANLDPRVGTDAQSERIDALLFDGLVNRDEHFNLVPGLAERWEILDPVTYIFHLRPGVRFSDGRPLTSRDVKWTFDSILSGAVLTPKAGSYRLVERVLAPDDATVIFHLKEPYSPLLWNLSNPAIGIVPMGSGADFNQHLVGSGPFRLVRLEQDKEVVIERNPAYWGTPARVERVRFAVVPDTTTRALELRKGSADLEINALTADMVVAIEKQRQLDVMRSPGSTYAYLAFNLRDPILKDVRVRQAIAYAIDRGPMIHYLWRDMARPAASVLPPEHWAYDGGVRTYGHDPARARQLLDAAGYPERNGVRFHLTMNTSTEESTRLMAAVLQQQLREAGIALDIRTFEFATFYSDVQKGAFQLFSLRWVGGNEDPDIFEHVFSSKSFPPKRGNRGYYSNPRVDELIDDARSTVDRERRKRDYDEIQRIVAEELPYVNLWYFDNVLVHSGRVRSVEVGSAGNYDFLKRAELAK
ncbi:MAG TPA: ABC transporter substrate-binding protein [Terriglobales bacterium]|nr:ABC transporter substrate-binding protein [Terriglobales bacterium]